MANYTKIQDSNAIQAIKRAHRKKFIFMAFIFTIIVCIIFFFLFYFIENKKENRIAQEYSKIDLLYKQENAAAQQINAVNGSDQAKQSLPKIEPNNAPSMAQFYDFALKYPKEPYGWLAALQSSAYFIKTENLNKAAAILEKILPYTKRKVYIQIKVRTALAGIYSSENKTQQALDQLTIVEKYPHNPLINQSRYLKAQILYAAGNFEDAKKVLNIIVSTPIENSNAQTNDYVHQAKILLNKIG